MKSATDKAGLRLFRVAVTLMIEIFLAIAAKHLAFVAADRTFYHCFGSRNRGLDLGWAHILRLLFVTC